MGCEVGADFCVLGRTLLNPRPTYPRPQFVDLASLPPHITTPPTATRVEWSQWSGVRFKAEPFWQARAQEQTLQKAETHDGFPDASWIGIVTSLTVLRLKNPVFPGEFPESPCGH